MLLGVLSDIHGDWPGFLQALRCFERAGVQRLICAGDVVDRGPDADRIAAALQQLPVVCVRGNHEGTLAANQARWRASPRASLLTRTGRIVSDATLAWMATLPATATLAAAGQSLLVTHGAPWSDVATLGPDSRPGVLRRLLAECPQHTGVIVGHSHRPGHLLLNQRLHLLNPGSVYGVTGRDSHTCMLLRLPDWHCELIDLATGVATPLPPQPLQVPLH